jgi:hypothetical protein
MSTTNKGDSGAPFFTAEDFLTPIHRDECANIANAKIQPVLDKLAQLEKEHAPEFDRSVVVAKDVRIKELENEIGLHSGELIGQEHRLGTMYEARILKLEAALRYAIETAQEMLPHALLMDQPRLKKQIDKTREVLGE